MLEQMEKIKKEEEKKGKFLAVKGEIDQRESNLKDINLH